LVNSSTKETSFSKEINDEKMVACDNNTSLSYHIKDTKGKKEGELTFLIPVDVSRKILSVSNNSKYGLYAILLSAISYVIYRLSNQVDVVIGYAPLKSVDCMKNNSNPMAMKFKINNVSSYKEYLLEIGQTLRAEMNGKLSGEMTTNNDFYRVVLLLESIQDIKSVETWDIDMLITCKIVENQIQGHIYYNVLLLKNSYIERVADYINNYLSIVMDNPDIKLENISLLTGKEMMQIIREFNNTRSIFPQEKTIYKLFEEQVEKTPDAIAIIYGNTRLSYRDLNNKSNKLARIIRGKGVNPDSIVGIMVERSYEMIVGIMGILKAGGAYMPIDPDYPSERIKYMLDDSCVRLLLSSHSIENNIEFAGEVIKLDIRKLGTGKVSNLSEHARADNLAYVIYTSGSTGKPKGVMIEHKSVINRLNWMQKKYPISNGDVILQKTPFTFDVSVWELFWWFFNGATLCFLESGTEKEPLKIINAIETHKVTIMHFVPSMLQVFINSIEKTNTIARLSSLKRVFSSGESLTIQQVEKFNNLLGLANGTALTNLYGPTEATVDVTFFDCAEYQSETSIPIGKPIDNTRMYILNSSNLLQPIGIAGELCISGDGLARGYLNKPELTLSKFVENPFEPGQKMYKTGDLARWLPDGNIEFLGRTDYQVKIRGYRIELGEIENQISKYEGVENAVVVDRGDGADKYLYAYFTCSHRLNIELLREYLREYLPSYMVPTYFMQLDAMPLSHNGKVDRKRLPVCNATLPTMVEPPETETEKSLARIWSELLKIETVGVQDDFINLGGHSLKAIDAVHEISERFNVNIPIGTLYKLSNIKNIARYIENAERCNYEKIASAETKDYYIASPAQKRMFILNVFSPESTAYNLPFAWTIKGKLDVAKLEEAFVKLITRHEALRTSLHMIGEEIVQHVHALVNFKIHVSEMAGATIDEVAKDFITPFTLENAPLLRVKLIRESDYRHIMLLDIHHSVSDAISIEILYKELAALYRGDILAEQKVQYKDYSVWQRNMVALDKIRKQEKYWLSVYEGSISELDMPLDYQRKQVFDLQGDSIYFSIKSERLKFLRSFSINNQVTVYTILMAAYTILLSKYTNQEDIIIGIPVTGRGHKDLNNVMGVFVDTLAIRNYPRKGKGVLEFINETKENLLRAYENQDYQFEDLVDKLDVKRDSGRNPIFDTMLNLVGKPKISIEGLEFEEYRLKNHSVLFDFELNGEEETDQIVFRLAFKNRLYRKETMERFASNYLNIIEQIIVTGDSKIQDIVDNS
jgi:amino acid adenylation domain-containing protein